MKTHLVKWDEAYRKKGLVIVNVDNGQSDTMDAIKAAVEESGIKYPVAWDAEAKVCSTYAVKGYAASFLIGTDGKVVWEGFPLGAAIEKREELVKKELAKVTAEELKKIEKELAGK